MPSTSKPPIPPAAIPVYGRNFDPWNSVSTGHQRAETTGPQGWRGSRNRKLQNQFVSGHTGGKRVFDTVGAGSPDFEEKSNTLTSKELRARAVNSVANMLRRPGTMHLPASVSRETSPSVYAGTGLGRPDENTEGDDGLKARDMLTTRRKEENDEAKSHKSQNKSIFDGLVVYVNGSTHPVVSDHKLKHLLSENGARMSMHLGRRQVTHVIVGKPNGASGGAGGGLAGGKLEKEIKRVGGCGIKFVGVEWVLESIKAGKRLPEARFTHLKIASKGQQSVLGAFSRV